MPILQFNRILTQMQVSVLRTLNHGWGLMTIIVRSTPPSNLLGRAPCYRTEESRNFESGTKTFSCTGTSSYRIPIIRRCMHTADSRTTRREFWCWIFQDNRWIGIYRRRPSSRIGLQETIGLANRGTTQAIKLGWGDGKGWWDSVMYRQLFGVRLGLQRSCKSINETSILSLVECQESNMRIVGVLTKTLPSLQGLVS